LFKLVLRNAPVFINIELAVLEGTESARTNVACFVGAAAVAVADVAGFPARSLSASSVPSDLFLSGIVGS
jgi:hypothetical protein